LNASKELSKYEVETLVDCDSFACVDVLLIRWIVDGLRAEVIVAEKRRTESVGVY